MNIVTPFIQFFKEEKASGIILIVCTLVSLILANSFFGESYQHFWHTDFDGHPLEYWINDGLMTVFFLMIGLELEHEIYQGGLSDMKNALLPIFGALGGMVVPAAIFLMFNFGTSAQSGAGIPMATDIAFALAILSLLGNKVPLSLKIFLTALAVIDDLGAILIIAFFYTKTIIWINLLLSLGIFALLLVLNRIKIRNLIPYIIGGIFMWYFMLNSGVHATITGVLLAFVIPFGDGHKKSASNILQAFLHKPVVFVILPLFALANTAIVVNSDFAAIFSQHYSIGILLGLIVGKPLGITLFALAAIRFGICKLPEDLNFKAILGTGMLGGIGFTMSIFITLLAFEDVTIINNAKIIILVASLVSGIMGYLFLKLALKTTITATEA